MKKILIAGSLILMAGCLSQSQYPPPSHSERSQTVPSMSTEVREASRNVVALTVTFDLKNPGPFPFIPFMRMPPSLKSGGTGFMIQPGIIITARHILMGPVLELATRGFPFEISGPSGMPKSRNNLYGYYFRATTNIDGDSKDFEVVPVAMGRLGEHKDFMVLKAVNYPTRLKPISMTELKEQDPVYISGYIPVFLSYPDSEGKERSVLADIIKENFEGQVYEVIKNMPVNKAGVETYYRIRGDAEQGFSGGPVLARDGRVGAVTLAVTRNFIYAVSIKEVADFVDSLPKQDN